MRKIRNLWRNLYDVRPGEYGRTLFMFLYMLFVLFAYYILKPVSQAMFLNKFDVDDLPFLTILVALGGGALAYLYSKLIVRASLRTAVFWSSVAAVACLVVIWYLVGLRRPGGEPRLPWMIYVLNVWVTLYSITFVTQGWVVATNIFSPREAKRLYSILVVGLVCGAVFGGEFTARTAKAVGTHNLLLAAAALVILAYGAFRLAAAQHGVSLAGVHAEGEEADFTFHDVVRDIGHIRHLQVIIGIIGLVFVVDVLVNFQFQVMAKYAYKGDQLTAFLGRFYGVYLSVAEFAFQLILTPLIVGRFGAGGALNVMPAAITAASLATVGAPSVLTTGVARLTESVTRYTLNKTGMELLYMPLPLELRNRIKAFIDIFFDRMSRGVGGLVLLLLTRGLHLDARLGVAGAIRVVALLAIVLTIPWLVLTIIARREYVATVRKRLEARRLDLESLRVTVEDRETVTLLEQTLAAANPRQVTYALSLLGEAPGYDLSPQLRRLAESDSAEVRAKVYELARANGFADIREVAARERDSRAVPAAVVYRLSVSPAAAALAQEYLESQEQGAAQGALQWLDSQPGVAAELISHEWLTRAAQEERPERRVLAAMAIGVRGDQGTEALFRLLNDPDPQVVAAACGAAGKLRSRAYFHPVAQHLGNARLRAQAIEALAAYGPQICGSLGDILEDTSLPLRVRLQAPRVLRLIAHQRSADVLIGAIGHQDLAIRAAVLKALNSLRDRAPGLNYQTQFVTEHLHKEARHYFGLSAALEPFRARGRGPVTELLARTIEERLRQTLERIFRLLGLQYPPREIHSAYLALSRRQSQEFAAAVDFLDHVVERDLKRILLPLLDAPENLTKRGRDLFGLELLDAEGAIRSLIRSGDPWLVSCAMAAAAELRLRSLAPEIARAAEKAEAEVYEVARSAQAKLAA